MPKTQGGQILSDFCSSLTISMKFDSHKKEALLEHKHFTGNMHLLTASHTFNTSGNHVAFTSTTIFKKCGVKSISGW